MYEQYWGLNEAPFTLTPDPRFLYMSRAHEDALMMTFEALDPIQLRAFLEDNS